MFRNTLKVFGLTERTPADASVKGKPAAENSGLTALQKRRKGAFPAAGCTVLLALTLGAASCFAAPDSVPTAATEVTKETKVSDDKKSAPQPAAKSKPLPAFDACFTRQAEKTGIPENLLRAIAQVESSGNPRAVAGPKGREDLGLMQINVQWLKKFGLTREELLSDACLNIEVASGILSDNFARHANPWEAVGAYNAGCSKLKGAACTEARQSYAWKVWRAWKSIETRKEASA